MRAASGAEIAGKVRTVAPSVDPQTRIALVYVDLPPSLSSDMPLKAGPLPPDADRGRAEYFWPEGYALTLFCLNVRSAVLEQEFDATTTTTPSSSATITSPAFTICPPQTTGTLTEPKVSLTVPCAEIAADQTGNPIAVRSRTSRTPASTIRPRQPFAMALVASKSPK